MQQRALARVSNKLPLFSSCIVLEAFSLPSRGFGHWAQQTKDFLRFWMVDIHREGCCQKSAHQKRHEAYLTSAPWKWGWDHRVNKVHCTWGECTRQAPGCLSCSDREGKKHNPTKSGPLWSTPENLNLSGLSLGSAHNSGSTLCRADWSLRSVDGESTHAGSVDKPSVAGTLCQWYLSAVTLPPHSTTEQQNLNKSPPLPTCVRVEIRHWRNLKTEAK